MTHGSDRAHRHVVLAAWLLVAGAAGGAVAAMLPDAALARLVRTVDPDRSVRLLFDGDPAFLRVAWVLWAASLGIAAFALLRWNRRIAGWLALSSTAEGRDTPQAAWAWWVLGALVILGVGLRWLHLGLPLEGDESQTYIFYASRSLLDVVSDYTTPNNHVLHTIFVWISTQLFGAHPVALRAPAFVAGVAAIPVAFFLGRRERGVLLGLALAAFIAVGPPFVEFSGRARGYTLQLLLLLWCLTAARRAMAGEAGSAWLELALASALGMWTSPSFMLPLGGVATWMLWLRHDRPFVTRLATSLGTGAALTLTLYAPVMVRSGVRSLASPDAWDPRSLPDILRMGSREAELLAECWSGGIGAFGWPILLPLGAGLLWGLRRGDPWARLVACALLWYMALTLTRGLKPRARMLNWLLPLLFLGAAGWVAWTRDRSARAQRWWGLAILAVAAAWGAAQVRGHAEHRERFVRGHDGENFCTGGYFADSEKVATAFAEVYRRDEVLVTPPNAGLHNPIRVHLMRRGITPAAAFPFAPTWGAERVAGFPTWYVVTSRHRWDRSVSGPAFSDLEPGDELDRVASLLRTEPEALRDVAESAEIWREFENAVVFRVRMRPEVAARAERIPDRDLVAYGW